MLSRKEIKTLKYWTWTGPSCSPPRSTSTYSSLWHLANERERDPFVSTFHKNGMPLGSNPISNTMV